MQAPPLSFDKTALVSGDTPPTEQRRQSHRRQMQTVIENDSIGEIIPLLKIQLFLYKTYRNYNDSIFYPRFLQFPIPLLGCAAGWD